MESQGRREAGGWKAPEWSKRSRVEENEGVTTEKKKHARGKMAAGWGGGGVSEHMGRRRRVLGGVCLMGDICTAHGHP